MSKSYKINMRSHEMSQVMTKKKKNIFRKKSVFSFMSFSNFKFFVNYGIMLLEITYFDCICFWFVFISTHNTKKNKDLRLFLHFRPLTSLSVFHARLIMWLFFSSLQCGVQKARHMCTGNLRMWSSLTIRQSSHSFHSVHVHNTSLLVSSLKEKKSLIVF